MPGPGQVQHPGPAPASTKSNARGGRRRGAGRTIAIVFAVLLALALVIATVGYFTLWLPKKTGPLHPTDPNGGWISDRYAHGAQWFTPTGLPADGLSSSIIGVSPSHDTVFYDNNTEDLYGVDLMTGDAKWVFEGLRCDGMVGEQVGCLQQVGNAVRIVLVDGAGDATEFARPTMQLRGVRIIDFDDQGNLLLVGIAGREDGSMLMSWSPGATEPNWLTNFPASWSGQFYAAPYVTIGGLDMGYFVDARTGEKVGKGYLNDMSGFPIADGFITAAEGGGYIVFDVEANKLGQISGYAVTPSAFDSGGGVVYTAEDYLLGERMPRVVDAAGNGIVYQNALEFSLLENGKVVEGINWRVPPTFIGATADGSLIMVQDYPHWSLIDREGNELLTIESGIPSLISNGIIIDYDRILRPGR